MGLGAWVLALGLNDGLGRWLLVTAYFAGYFATYFAAYFAAYFAGYFAAYFAGYFAAYFAGVAPTT